MTTRRQQPTRHYTTDEMNRVDTTLSTMGTSRPSKHAATRKLIPDIKQSPPDSRPSSSAARPLKTATSHKPKVSNAGPPLPPKAPTSQKPLRPKATTNARLLKTPTSHKYLHMMAAISRFQLKATTNARPPLQPNISNAPPSSSVARPLRLKTATSRKYLNMMAAISRFKLKPTTNPRPSLQPKTLNACSPPVQPMAAKSRKSLQAKPSKAPPPSSYSSSSYGTRGNLQSAKRRRSPSPEVAPAKRQKKPSLRAAESKSFSSRAVKENVPPSEVAAPHKEVNPRKQKAAASVPKPGKPKAVPSRKSRFTRSYTAVPEAVDSSAGGKSKKSKPVLPKAPVPTTGPPSTVTVDKFAYYEQDQSELFGDLENEEERHEEFEGNGHYAADIGEVIKNGGSNFHVIRKMGFGNFSLAWLAYETRKDAKKFCAIKIYKADHKTVSCEIKILKMVKNFDHIVQYHRSFQLKRNRCIYDCAVFEPLGSTLLTLLSRANSMANDHVGLKTDAIKKIARHILLGLNYLHTEMKLVHTDIKPENILTNVTERSLFLAVKDVHDADGAKQGMRAVHYRTQKTPFENGLEEVKHGLKKIMNEIPQPLSLKPKSRMQDRDTVSAEICWDAIKFKIIDLGNATAPGKKGECGTFDYRAPENTFAAPLNFSFDVWSVGCIIAELATDKQLFRSFGDENEFEDLIKSITYFLGKVPYSLYKDYDDPAKLLDEYSAEGDAQPDDQRGKLTAVFKNQCYDDEEIKKMVEFLLFIFNYDPNQRPTAEECLNHEWLN